MKETWTERRQRLLRNRTPYEIAFAYRLSNARIKYREQAPIGCYFADFLLPNKIVIELDGSGHFSKEGRQKDAKRDRFMRNQGYRVIRIPNNIVRTFDLTGLKRAYGLRKGHL